MTKKQGVTKKLEVESVDSLREQLDLLISYSTDTIYRLRYDTMRYDYISPSISKLLGFTVEEMKELNLRSLILETRMVSEGMKAVESFESLEDKRKKGHVEKWQADYLMQTKDGRRIWVSDISYPWFDANGGIIGSVGSLRDITDRVEAERKVKDELTRLANTDVLTGLSNRRMFFSTLEDELRRIRRTRNSLSILLMDVDHFKRINDTYGHMAGDVVLQAITRLMNECLRETDMAARLGGEEFGVFLPDTPVEGAYWVAERIRSSIANHIFSIDNEDQPVTCTVSIGVAAAKFSDELDAAGLYKIADTRLYIAKNTGRNQVSLDELASMH